jgi:signal transduction histidine kinase
VQANAARLGQVFLNLLINAAHAIEPGRVRENEIRVVARVFVPGQVTVEVRDTGVGIPPEHLRRIFDPFFTTKPVGVGTGLGLSVCHRIITSLGGDIRVESEPGRGTCFFVTLPVAADSQESASPPAA